MLTRLIGVETEYALTGKRQRGILLQQLMDLAGERIVHLRGAGAHDLYLRNGSRLYIDCGGHPELSTPECTGPGEAVRYILAGDKILADLMRELGANGSGATLFKCNVDYSGASTTWGCHESYLHKTDPRVLPQQLIPHLVSRVIYAGGGGFNSLSAGLAFTLSPRAWHLVHEVSGESTHSRGIFHTKNESLSKAGYGRLHLLCGESLCSEIASWLKLGTTALVVAMTEAGLRPGDAVRLRAPLEALRTFASDVRCASRVPLADARLLSAVEIQRHYLVQAEARVGDAAMPPWAEKVCLEWRAMLGQIESDPESLVTTLDWSIKHALYRDRLARCGLAWDALPALTHVVEELRRGLRSSGYKGSRPTVELLLGRRSPIPETIRALTPYLDRESLRWEQLRPFVDLRHELFEIDTRFGQVGDGAIFAALSRAGLLEHAAPDVGNVDDAVSNPPPAGRARLRGESIGRFAAFDGYRCGWDRIYDVVGGRMMDLSDPFAATSEWKKAAMRDPRDEWRRLIMRRAPSSE